MTGNILSTVSLIFLTIIIIVFAYYTTIVIGKKTNKFYKDRTIQVLEKNTIGLNTSIVILKINKKIYIIAQQAKTMQLLDTINEEDWDFKDYQNKDILGLDKKNQNSYIASIFKKIKNYNNKRYS